MKTLEKNSEELCILHITYNYSVLLPRNEALAIMDTLLRNVVMDHDGNPIEPLISIQQYIQKADVVPLKSVTQ